MWERRYHSVVLPVDFTVQQTDHTCGPACLKIVLRSLGLEGVKENILAKLCQTTEQHGTDPNKMAPTLRAFGVRCREVRHGGSVEDIENELDNFRLCIVEYRAWGQGGTDINNGIHYSVIFGYDRTHFFMADPYKGEHSKSKRYAFRTIRKDLFQKRWWARDSHGKKIHHWYIAVSLKQRANGSRNKFPRATVSKKSARKETFVPALAKNISSKALVKAYVIGKCK